MNRSAIPEFKPPSGITVPRWVAITLALFVWLVGIPFAHGVIPWAISRFTPRYGWHAKSPGVWNLFGLVVVVVAAALLTWILATGIANTPDRVRLGLTPSVLITTGPYRLTRNPMYVAELGLWLGWSLFFGSPSVFLGLVLLLLTLNFIILPREERGLERAFGPAYLQYKSRVPRW